MFFLYLLQEPHVKIMVTPEQVTGVGVGSSNMHDKDLAWTVSSGNMKEERIGESSKG